MHPNIKPDFLDNLDSAHRDPLAPTHQDFDFDEVSRNLGEPIPPDRDEALHIAGNQILRFFQRMLGPCALGPNSPREISQRVVNEAARMFPNWSHPTIQKFRR